MTRMIGQRSDKLIFFQDKLIFPMPYPPHTSSLSQLSRSSLKYITRHCAIFFIVFKSFLQNAQSFKERKKHFFGVCSRGFWESPLGHSLSSLESFYSKEIRTIRNCSERVVFLFIAEKCKRSGQKNKHTKTCISQSQFGVYSRGVLKKKLSSRTQSLSPSNINNSNKIETVSRR